MNGTELKFGERGGVLLQLPVEVKALCGVAVELKLVGDFLVDALVAQFFYWAEIVKKLKTG